MKGLHGFILKWTFLNFLDFYEKNPCKKKKVGKIVSTNKKNNEHI